MLLREWVSLAVSCDSLKFAWGSYVGGLAPPPSVVQILAVREEVQ